METFRNFQKEELTDLNQIQGGKRVRSYNALGKKIDVKKVDKNGKVIWSKHWR